MTPSVYTDIHEHVAEITFSRPPVNALPSQVLQELETHITRAGETEGIKIIVLKSTGKTFCAGASFDELIALDNHEDAKAFFLGFARVINAMRKVPVPVITRVQGKAVGGGTGIIAASDLSVATEKASVKLSEVSIGIGPYVIAPAIVRKTGIAFFQEMSFQPFRWFTAFRAKDKGLFAHVTENENRMDETIQTITDAYKNYDSRAIAMLKREVWKDAEDWDILLEKQAEKSARLLLREDVKKLLHGLLNKK